jgi:hypothetical protein
MNDTIRVTSLSVLSATLAPIRRCAYFPARFRDNLRTTGSRKAVEDGVAR